MSRRTETLGRLRMLPLHAERLSVGRLPRALFRKLRGRAREVRFFHRVDDPESLLILEGLVRLRVHVPLSIELIVVPEPSADFDPEPARSMARKRRDAHELSIRHGLEPLPETIEAPPPARVRMIQATLLAAEAKEERLVLASELGRALFRDDGERIAEAARDLPPLSSLDLRLTLEANYKRLRSDGFYEGACFSSESERFIGVESLGDFEARVRGIDEPERSPARHRRPGPFVRQRVVFLGSLERASDAMGFLALHPHRDSLELHAELIRPFRFEGMRVPEERLERDRREAFEFARRAGLRFGPFHEQNELGMARAHALFALGRDQGNAVDLLATIYRAIWLEARDFSSEGDLMRVASDAALGEEIAREAVARSGEPGLMPPLATERLEELELPEGPVFCGQGFAYSGLDRFPLLMARLSRAS